MFINTPTVIFVAVFVWGNIFDQHLEINILPRNLFGGIVRFIFGLLLCGIILTANARVLHVGDNTIKLSQAKTTTPALHIKVDGEIWYGNMCTNFNTNSLHIKYNGTVYNVIEPFTDTTNYTYDENGRLIGANNNLYLESTGTQWIDTGFIANQDTRIVAYAQAATEAIAFFGSRTSSVSKDAFYFICAGIGYYRTDYGSYAIVLQRCKHNQKLLIDKNKNITTLTYEDLTTYTNTVTYHQFTTPLSIGIFALNYPAGIDFAPAGTIFYYIKIWDNDVLVRHFVPVPCGLQIGDFVVPSNGMWDIVEQKFYGNMGTGDFIYGIDE